MSGTVSKKTYAEDHPEQDPAEGSREVVDHDLKESAGDDRRDAPVQKEKPQS